MYNTQQTRGERNNNPWNLNYLPTGGFNGQIGLELVPTGKTYKPRFGRYDNIEHGLRAGGLQLLAYFYRHHLSTVRQMVERWAPASDNNNTKAYVQTVCKWTGLGPDDIIPLNKPEALAVLMVGFINQENGRCMYDKATLLKAATDAWTSFRK